MEGREGGAEIRKRGTNGLDWRNEWEGKEMGRLEGNYVFSII